MYVCMVFFFFKQKTAYEMRISDWSSDVCSSDLPPNRRGSLLVSAKTDEQYGVQIVDLGKERMRGGCRRCRPLGAGGVSQIGQCPDMQHAGRREIGRASCRERVCQYG